MMNLFRLALVAAWLVMLWVTVSAVRQLGIGAAGGFFIGDMAHPWRAQFNTDFAIHLLLVAAWLVWSAKNWLWGLVFAVLAINLGALFTLAYLLVRSFQTQGNIKALLLGRHYTA